MRANNPDVSASIVTCRLWINLYPYPKYPSKGKTPQKTGWQTFKQPSPTPTPCKSTLPRKQAPPAGSNSRIPGTNRSAALGGPTVFFSFSLCGTPQLQQRGGNNYGHCLPQPRPTKSLAILIEVKPDSVIPSYSPANRAVTIFTGRRTQRLPQQPLQSLARLPPLQLHQTKLI